MKRLLLFLVITWATFVAFAQTRIDTEQMLGAGGSQFSQKKPDSHGLLTSQFTGQHWLVGAYCDVDYSCFFDNMNHTSHLPGGGGSAIGLVFDYQRNFFILQLGLGLAWQNVRNKVDSLHKIDLHVIDKWGTDYTLIYEFENRIDRSRNLYMQVPIMFGARYDQFYALLGVKVNIPIWGNTQVKCDITTKGSYERYCEIFEEMDNHGLRRCVPYVYKGPRICLKTDVLLCAEIGYEWAKNSELKGSALDKENLKAQQRIRLAAFLDWGMLNVNPLTQDPAIDIPAASRWDFETFRLSHSFSTPYTQGKHIHALYAGLRFTYLIGAPILQKCIICGPFGTEQVFK